MESFLQDYTPVAIALITLFAGGVGYVIREIVGNVYSKKKEARELKAFLWKEKIQAAKKASEFYYEQLNYLELAHQQLKMEESEDEIHPELARNISDTLESYRVKVQSFPHQEYHHINMFYDLDDLKVRALASKLFDLNIEISNIKFLDIDSDNENEEKFALFKSKTSQLRQIHLELIDFYKAAIKNVRDDINAYL